MDSPKFAKEKMLFHQKKCKGHRCVITIEKLSANKAIVPPYSPDSVPSFYLLLPTMKLSLKQTACSRTLTNWLRNETFCAVQTVFHSQSLDLFIHPCIFRNISTIVLLHKVKYKLKGEFTWISLPLMKTFNNIEYFYLTCSWYNSFMYDYNLFILFQYVALYGHKISFIYTSIVVAWNMQPRFVGQINITRFLWLFNY